MTTKEILQRVELLDTQIDYKLQEIQRLWAMVTRVTAVFKPTPVSGGGGSGDMMADTIGRIVELKAEVNQDVDRFVDLKREIAGTLNRLQNPEHIKVLYKRYFERKHWEEIAVEMNMSHRAVYYTHGRALEEFKNLWGKNDGEKGQTDV